MLTVQQDDGQAEGELDFHLFEVMRMGRQSCATESAMETGDRVESKLLPGSISYGPANTSFRQSWTGNATLQHIYIDDRVFRDVAENLKPDRSLDLLPLAFQGVFIPSLRQLADALLVEARTGSLGGDLYADLIAQQMAIIILRRWLDLDGTTKQVNPLSDSEIAKVVEYLEENLEDVGGMDALASLVSMDVYTFTRSFKARTGEAPHQFLIQRRLAKVKDLLVHSRTSLAEIAYATGFSNQSHMTTTFGKHVGTTPGKYRKEMRH